MPWKEIGGVLATIAILTLLYVGCYCVMLERTEVGLEVSDSIVMLNYRFGGKWAEWLFEPIHTVDRMLRPECWHNEMSGPGLSDQD
jgi:hypothetical protein